jgi:thiamine-phosphate pyrophosphorylase
MRAALPAVAIGGIDASNVRQALDAGANGVAVIRAIFAAPDPERAAQALSSATGR